MKTTIYTLLSLFLASCSLINFNVAPEDLNIDYTTSEALLLKPYVDKYLKEASKRDVRFNHKSIELSVEIGDEKDVLAKACFYCRQLVVYNNSRVWKEMQSRDFDVNYGVGLKLIAHELTHTLLNTDHRGYKGETMRVFLDDEHEEALLSVMTQGDNDVPDLSNAELSNLWEQYYWDELFEIIPTNKEFDLN
ncbi:hypothetical protein [Flammeovirga sp. OC4]|uniref:hypothetical protein n=1 Tax=Flammeovirga sp. OC4 TaxID=1382345 RepID=UPI0005C72192|nr:hypothetical protein [Flammeovirga sp. OC4]